MVLCVYPAVQRGNTEVWRTTNVDPVIVRASNVWVQVALHVQHVNNHFFCLMVTVLLDVRLGYMEVSTVKPVIPVANVPLATLESEDVTELQTRYARYI